MLNLENAKNRIFDRVHRTGEEVKNDLPNWVERVVQDGAWKIAKDANGKPFNTVGEWLVSNYPLGPGVGSSRFAIKYEELIALCEDNFPNLCKLLKDSRPQRKRGGDRRSEDFKQRLPQVETKKKSPATGTRQYIEERLRREFPVVWKAYLNGEYKSARQAGIAAGFIKDSHDPLMRLKSNWNKASKSQRNAFLKWIKSQDK